MSNGSGGNNCKETIYHDDKYTFVRSEGGERTYIETVDGATYAQRLIATKERITRGLAAGWTPARLALSTELMFGHTPEEVDGFDEATHQSPSGLSRSEQFADAATIMEGMVDVGVIDNHDSVIARESMDHLPGQVNPLLSESAAAYGQPVLAAAVAA